MLNRTGAPRRISALQPRLAPPRIAAQRLSAGPGAFRRRAQEILDTFRQQCGPAKIKLLCPRRGRAAPPPRRESPPFVGKKVFYVGAPPFVEELYQVLK